METSTVVMIVVTALELLILALGTVVWARIGRIEEKVDHFPEALGSVHARVSDTNERVAKVEAKVESSSRRAGP